MAKTSTVSRRRFLRTTLGVVGVSVFACAGLTAGVGLRSPVRDFAEMQCTNVKSGRDGNVAKNILIAYASKCGSTGEVAEFIGKELCAAGATVDVRRVQEVSDLTGYDAVVVGSAARMGKLLAPARQFVEKRRNALAGIPVAYFTLGTTMIQDTPERRAMAASYLDPLRQIKAPVSEGLFAGKVDPSTMEPLWRFMLSYVKEGEMAPGDHRDWDIIRTWAGDLAGKLIAA